MVSYQTWTSIVFEVAQDGGAQIQNIEDGSSVVSVSAEVWNDRKADLKTATRAEARQIAESEITVS